MRQYFVSRDHQQNLIFLPTRLQSSSIVQARYCVRGLRCCCSFPTFSEIEIKKLEFVQFRAQQGCQIFLRATYQNGEKYT
jgi:hypothetical protein